MSRRSRGRRGAANKSHRPPAARGQGPIIRPAAEQPTTIAPAALAPRHPWEDTCPVCGAETSEIGGLGCCGAEVASCEGSIDGTPIDFDADTFTDNEIDARAQYYYWYTDTGEPAPAETGEVTVPCRCELAS